jgi:hypothetical protein
MPPRRTPKPSKAQKRYLRFLERTTDTPTSLGLTRRSAIGVIADLEHQYRLIYGRQPTMR